MQRKRIVVLTGHHACHNPRAFKEADALAEAGFEVEWLGAWFDSELARRDRLLMKDRKWRFAPVSDWTSTTFSSRLQRQRQRLRRWVGSKLHKLFGWENHWQLGYCTSELLRAALRRDADLFIAHFEPALWVADKLRQRGKRVGVDMEDWFSEDLLPEARKSRPLKLLRSLEQGALRDAVHATCTSHAMAGALSREYDCEPPVVIYNSFPWSDREKLDGLTEDRRNRGLHSIHWYSQTLGFGRGVEDLIGALPHLEHEAEIHLRGKITNEFKEWLALQLPVKWRERVFIHELVSNVELLSRIAEHDIGFSGEQKYCKSRDLTVTNKILQYLLAGLAVVASDAAGHREIADQASGAVYLYRAGDPQDLAVQLNQLLGSPLEMEKGKAAAVVAAEQIFCWEKDAPKLLAAVEGALMH